MLGAGALEDRYEYDAFGQPYKGELGSGMNLGYTGKPYDTATGLYNYGYRDYKPQAARFTTIDPIRDGSNWFAYVNNDPVNWIDAWGLSAGDVKPQATLHTTTNPTLNSAVLTGALEMISTGVAVMGAGGTLVVAGFAEAATIGIAGAAIAGVTGLGLVRVAVDLMTGNGLDKTKEVIGKLSEGFRSLLAK